MRLTAMTDYALRLLMYVAQRPERLCTIAEVAQAHGISEAHLMKVTHLLAQQNWIATVRGKGGGMRLAHSPAAINLGAVVRGMESDFALVECQGGASQCGLTGHCALAGVLDGALQSFMAHLDGFSLADVLPAAAPAAPKPVAVLRNRSAKPLRERR
ncbi:MAG: Rrf2 family transcriptional regulator [Acidovorax sp.]|jgi:Rrf2 family nitric oxide-sensitive transcriptional repressor|nr:Rrf2 family transcriptional regulator [Acidovorax sp.]